MIVAVTGIRDVAPLVAALAFDRALTALVAGGAEEIRFGGARGSDTLALVTAGRLCMESGSGCKLHVIVPFRVGDQPREAREAIRRWANDVTELDHPRGQTSAYFARNEKLLEGVQRCVAFTDGREQGGTAHTIRRAHALALDVFIVRVSSLGQLGGVA